MLLYIINIKAGASCITEGSGEPVMEINMQATRAVKNREKADSDGGRRNLTVINKISAIP